MDGIDPLMVLAIVLSRKAKPHFGVTEMGFGIIRPAAYYGRHSFREVIWSFAVSKLLWIVCVVPHPNVQSRLGECTDIDEFTFRKRYSSKMVRAQFPY